MQNYEEVHVPALAHKPFGKDEKLKQIKELPEWTQAAFRYSRTQMIIRSTVHFSTSNGEIWRLQTDMLEIQREGVTWRMMKDTAALERLSRVRALSVSRSKLRLTFELCRPCMTAMPSAGA